MICFCILSAVVVWGKPSWNDVYNALEAEINESDEQRNIDNDGK